MGVVRVEGHVAAGGVGEALEGDGLALRNVEESAELRYWLAMPDHDLYMRVVAEGLEWAVIEVR